MQLEGIILKEGASWSKEALKAAADTASGKPVRYSSETDAPVIGNITETEYRDGEGVYCTMEIKDDEISEMIEGSRVSPAPAIVYDNEITREISEFHSAFMTPHPDEDVGEFNRKI